MPDPTVWWNLLQNQFTQAISSALGPEAMQNATAMTQQAASTMAQQAAAAAAAATGQPASQPKPADGGAGAGTAAGGASKPRTPRSKVGKG
jgi:hypothetical protein